ncbi:MAG: RND family transporter, partial [Nitrospiria bacterium]
MVFSEPLNFPAWQYGCRALSDEEHGHMGRKYFEFVVNHSYTVMGLIGLITLFSIIKIGSIQTEIDPKQILPQDHPFIKTNNEIEKRFGGGRVIVIGVRAQDGSIFTPGHLAKIDRITQEVKSIPGIYADNVLSIASRRVKHLRFNEQGFDVDRLMPSVPTTLEESEKVRGRVFSNPLYVGSLVSSDATAAAIIIDVQDKETAQKSREIAGEDLDEPLSDSAIYERLQSIVDREEDAATRTHLGGLPISLAFLEKDTVLMNQWVFPIAFALIMFIHYLSFRTFQGMLIPSFTAILSVIWSMGLISLLGMKLDLWTKGLTPILIVAMAAGHSVQILRRFYEELDYAIGMDIPIPAQKAAAVEATSKMAPVVLAAGFVAAASFASLITFQLATFRSFGLMTSFGVLSALLLEMTFVPALRALIPPPSGKELETVLRKGQSDRLLSTFGRWALGPEQRWVLVGGVLMLLLPFIFVNRIGFANSLRSLFFEGTRLRQDDLVLNQKFGGTSTLNILVSTPSPGGLKEPAVMRAVEGLQTHLKENPLVGRSESYVDYVKRMRRSFYGDDPSAEKVPESREEAAQFLFLYSISGNPEDFKRMADVLFQKAIITTFLKSDSTVLGQDLIETIHQYQAKHFPPEVSLELAGSVPVTLALNEVVIHGKLLNIVQMIVICFILVSTIFRSFVAGLIVLIPLLIAVLWNFGFMGLVGIPLGISTAAVSAMAVGMGADYSIYILYRLREELSMNRHLEKVLDVTLRSAGKAILLIAMAFAAGTSLVAFPGYYL